MNDLWQHQKDAINRAHRERDLALFFEQGCGKTRTTGIIIRKKMEANPGHSVVVAPKIVLRQWEDELLKVGFEADCILVLDYPSKDIVKIMNNAIEHKRPTVFIINYEKMRATDVINRLKMIKPTCVVFDESHLIKTHNSYRSRAAVRLADSALHRYILTGTPIANSLEDIYNQFRCLDKGETFGKSFWGFRHAFFEDKNRYSPAHVRWPNWEPRPGSATKIRELMALKSMRVLKSECLDLPPLVRQTAHVELSLEQRRMYKEMKRDLISYIAHADETPAVLAQTAAVKALRLQQIICGHVKDVGGVTHPIKDNPRAKVLAQILEPLLVSNKVVIWCCFKHDIKVISEVLTKLKVEHYAIHGDVPQAHREVYVREFKSSPRPMAMIANQAAAGTGLDGLQTASYAVYYSKNFNLTNDLQSEARTHRSGSEIHDKVTRIDLITPNTIDEHIHRALEDKQNISNNVVNFVKQANL